MDLTNMQISYPEAGEAAAAVFCETVRERTGLQVPALQTTPGGSGSAGGRGRGRSDVALRLTIGTPASESIRSLREPGAEGFRIATEDAFAGEGTAEARVAEICGADSRGLLYGVGRFLRTVTLRAGSITLGAPIARSDTPAYPLRGHQLGYRPKTNAYDAWTKEQYRRYIMDLAIFGANSIEIMPPRTDDEARSPVMKYDALEMMAWLSETIHWLGLDVWVWYPNMGSDYADAEVRRAEREEREQVFAACPHIDHIFIPGGDPGDLEPDALFAWTSEVAEILTAQHRTADIWLSPQAFRLSTDWLEAFYRDVETHPDWLGGVVYGPWERDDLPTLRDRVPRDLPIRRYPDITHSLNCQYPVPNWDTSFAVTLGRECYNPRPEAHQRIHNELAEYACGSLSYSEGINDDINKFVWSDQDWNPLTPVEQTLREVAQLFIHADGAEEIAQCLIAFEEHWVGPVERNRRIPETLARMRRLETRFPDLADNYRFGMAAFRAHYDAYIQVRRTEALAAERRARAILGGAAAPVRRRAEAALECLDGYGSDAAAGGSISATNVSGLREECTRRADRLFEQIGWQTSVVGHHGQAVGRGAFLDAIDKPLGDVPHLRARLAELLAGNRDDTELDSALAEILGLSAPGGAVFEFAAGEMHFDVPGIGRAPVSVDDFEPADDPAHHRGALISFTVPRSYLVPDDTTDGEAGDPVPWYAISHVRTYYDTPLTVQLRGLVPGRPYKLRIVYAGSNWGTRCALTAGGITLADDLEIPRGIREITHDLPAGATGADGSLALSWRAADGYHGPGIARLRLDPAAAI